MAEQLSLFVEENTLFNTGLQQLLDMDFGTCKESLHRYQRLFPWGKVVSRELAMAEFWIERLPETTWHLVDETVAERAYQIWLEFEETVGHPWPEHGIEQRFQVGYFRRLAHGLDTGGRGEALRLSGGTPTGLIHLRAGRYDAAIGLLQTLLSIEPEDAAGYGYLGDAHAVRGDLHMARTYYRRAFALAPERVDIKHLCDTGLKARMEELEGDERVDGDALSWFPVIAEVEGLFDPLIIDKDLQEIRYWLSRYRQLLDVYDRDGDHALIPRLFYHGLVLSNNRSAMRFIREVDLIEVRKRLREWKGDLFALHMRELRERECK